MDNPTRAETEFDFLEKSSILARFWKDNDEGLPPELVVREFLDTFDDMVAAREAEHFD